MNRRKFIKFLGITALSSFLISCSKIITSKPKLFLTLNTIEERIFFLETQKSTAKAFYIGEEYFLCNYHSIKGIDSELILIREVYKDISLNCEIINFDEENDFVLLKCSNFKKLKKLPFIEIFSEFSNQNKSNFIISSFTELTGYSREKISCKLKDREIYFIFNANIPLKETRGVFLENNKKELLKTNLPHYNGDSGTPYFIKMENKYYFLGILEYGHGIKNMLEFDKDGCEIFNTKKFQEVFTYIRKPELLKYFIYISLNKQKID